MAWDDNHKCHPLSVDHETNAMNSDLTRRYAQIVAASKALIRDFFQAKLSVIFSRDSSHKIA